MTDALFQPIQLGSLSLKPHRYASDDALSSLSTG